MEGTIKVTPEVLLSKSAEFSAQGQKLNATTNRMMELAQALTTSWQGEASQVYFNKFKGLEDDMQKLFRMVQEHSRDLEEMANNYANAEKQNEELGNSLSADVII